MTRLTYAKMLSADDVDISYITKYYENPKVSHFLSIGDNYFSYVTGTENVHFYKVYSNETLVGVVHLEKQKTSLFLSVLVFPEFQKMGFGTRIIDDVKKDVFGLDYDRIEVSVDEKNTASLRLFKNAGFTEGSKQDELINFTYIIE